MNSASKIYGRGKSCSLETLAIVNGILESPASKAPLIERIRNHLISRGNDGSGFVELQRRVNALDRDGTHTLSLDDLRVVLNRINVGLNDKEIGTVFQLFDPKQQGYIDIDEFLVIIRGALSGYRRDLVDKAFESLDRSGSNLLVPEGIIL